MRLLRVLALSLLAGALSIAPAHSQEQPPPTHFSASLGLFQFDLAGTGLAPAVALRGSTPISSVIVLEGGLLAARPRQQFGQTTTFLVPEAQLQLAVPFTAVLPYMVLGFGGAFDFRGAEFGGTGSDFTVSGALGVRTWFGDRLGLQVEFRGRGIGFDFAGSSAEYTAGAIWRR
jgi:hypothetical protein